VKLQNITITITPLVTCLCTAQKQYLKGKPKTIIGQNTGKGLEG